MNTLAPIVSRSELFQRQSRTLLSSHIVQVSDEKQIESVAISVIAGWRQGPLTICDVSQRNYFTPTEHHIGSAVYTRDDRDRVLPRSSYHFPLPIMSLFNPILEYISSCHQNMFGNNIEPSDTCSELQVSSVR